MKIKELLNGNKGVIEYLLESGNTDQKEINQYLKQKIKKIKVPELEKASKIILYNNGYDLDKKLSVIKKLVSLSAKIGIIKESKINEVCHEYQSAADYVGNLGSKTKIKSLVKLAGDLYLQGYNYCNFSFPESFNHHGHNMVRTFVEEKCAYEAVKNAIRFSGLSSNLCCGDEYSWRHDVIRAAERSIEGNNNYLDKKKAVKELIDYYENLGPDPEHVYPNERLRINNIMNAYQVASEVSDEYKPKLRRYALKLAKLNEKELGTDEVISMESGRSVNGYQLANEIYKKYGLNKIKSIQEKVKENEPWKKN